MRIRTKIMLSHALLSASVALACLAAIYAQQVGDKTRRHLSASYEQLRNLDLIAVEAKHYLEQIAELVIIGPQGQEMEHARDVLRTHLKRQRELVSDEVNWVSAKERELELREVDRVAHIETVLDEMDQVHTRLEQLVVNGQKDDASALYRDQIEHRLDELLFADIDALVSREVGEVREISTDAARLSRTSAWVTLGMVPIVLALGAFNILMLNRTVLRPVTALADAADAVGRGDLSRVVETHGRDELGNLANRFNRMTGEIRSQRTALERANLDLEAQVKDRTVKLQARSTELEEANARLRDVDASRARFFADLSHELRTPLTILRGQAEVALRRGDGDARTLRETLMSIVRKADQMGRLVEDMLFLARSEHGSVGVEMKPVVLQDVVADALLDSRTLARDKRIVLSPQQPIEPIEVRGDAGRLRQAVLILLDNAIKFAPEGSVVRIALERENGRIYLRVRDEGPGFSDADARQAFVRFYRGADTSEPTGRGVGLGLAIARWIVERHSGRIGVEKVSDTGATVYIDLPGMVAAA